MKKHTTLFAGLTAAMVLAGSYAAYSQVNAPQQRGQGRQGMQHRMGGGMRGGGMGPFAALKLSQDQRDKVRDIQSDRQAERIDAQAKMQIASLELRKLMAAQNPDRARIREAARSISSLREKMMEAQIDSFLEVRKVLTPEQQKIFSQNIEQGRGMGFGMGQGRGMGMKGMGQGRGMGMRGMGMKGMGQGRGMGMRGQGRGMQMRGMGQGGCGMQGNCPMATGEQI